MERRLTAPTLVVLAILALPSCTVAEARQRGAHTGRDYPASAAASGAAIASRPGHRPGETVALRQLDACKLIDRRPPRPCSGPAHSGADRARKRLPTCARPTPTCRTWR